MGLCQHLDLWCMHHHFDGIGYFGSLFTNTRILLHAISGHDRFDAASRLPAYYALTLPESSLNLSRYSGI
ncbi:hypothetical protein L195_g024585, partial [Trifolium pratense]